jgi:ribosomal-protein-alanine N-acetyltransferase
MKLMADATTSPLPTARTFPDAVPVLIDAEAGITLRATSTADLACGSIDLRLKGDGIAEVGFGLHPEARGHSIMTAALHLVCDYGFNVAGLRVIRWRAAVGNWASRRVAANVGFVFDGTVRHSLVHWGDLLDGWVATLTRSDPRVSQPWLNPVELQGNGVRLRAFRVWDVDRIVEACSDPDTSYWLISMPQPFERDSALAYLDGITELAARRLGVAWCITDLQDDRCLGLISFDGLGGYAKRGEIGYWAHPDARGGG